MQTSIIRYFILIVLFAANSSFLFAQDNSEMPNLNHFRLYSDKYAVIAGQSIKISLQSVNLLAPLVDKSATNDDLLEPLVKPSVSEEGLLTSLVKDALLQEALPKKKAMEDTYWTDLSSDQYTSIKWEVRGPGKVTVDPNDPAKVTFLAPASAGGTAYVTANIIGLSETKAKAKSKMVSKLTIPVIIIKDQYVIFNVNGKSFVANGDCESGCIYHKPGDQFHFKVTIGGKELLVMTDSYSEGSYAYGNEEENDNVATVSWETGLKDDEGKVVGNKSYTSSYLVSTDNCVRCKTKYSEGNVQINKVEEIGEEIKLTKAEETALKNGTASQALYEKMAKQVGGSKTTYAEGFFKGTLYYQGEQEDAKSVSGIFRVKAW